MKCLWLVGVIISLGCAVATPVSYVQVINEVDVSMQGLKVQGMSGGLPKTIFARAKVGEVTEFVTVDASSQVMRFTNISNGDVVASVTFAPVANQYYSLFVSSSLSSLTPVHVAVLSNNPPASAWPLQRTDQALFRVVNADLGHVSVAVNTTSANCWDCLAVFRTVAQAAPVSDPGFLHADVPHEYVVTLSAFGVAMPAELMSATYPWRETGVYTVVIPAQSRGGAARAYVVAHDNGRSVATPLLIWAGVLVAIAGVYNAVRLCAARAGKSAQRLQDPSSPAAGTLDADLAAHATYDAPEAASAGVKAGIKPGSKGRVMAIDSFRGMALCIMIFVNYGGGGYWFLNHSWWNGLTVADLVFPWFVWIMGTSMAISHASARRKRMSTPDILLKLLVRSVKLFCIGLFLNNGMDLSNWRILGVLQYFAVGGLTVGLVSHLVPLLPWGQDATQRGSKDHPDENFNNAYGTVIGAEASNDYEIMVVRRKNTRFSDFLPFLLQWAVVLSLVAAYLCIQFLLDVPGCGRGYIGPGGNGNHGLHKGCTGGAHGYIDRMIFGYHHMYHDLDASGVPISAATCAGITRYDCNVYDPEGTLGYLTATFICFMGLQAGRILTSYKSHSERITRWVVWGLVECAIGTALCGASQNDGIIPLAKNVWSPSFVLVMAGTGNLVLAVFYWLIDVKHFWGGGPFKFVGMNSIIIYANSEILQSYFPFSIMLYRPYNDNLMFHSHTGALVGNTIGVATWMLIAYTFYRNKFFVNV